MSRHARPSVQRAAASGESVRRATPSTQGRSATSGRGRTDSQHRSSGEQSFTRASSRDSNADDGNPNNQLFACPYAKYDPDRYSHVNIDRDEAEYRNCSTGYWTSISRLKQHLYRTHDKTQRCPNCWKHFPTEKSLADHVEKRSCQSKEEPEGLMTVQQHDAISRREHGQEVEKWLKIYQILFPEEDLPGSVYPEWVTGKDLRTCFELLDKAVPTLLYKKFAQSQPNLQGVRPNTTTPFQTNAEIVQEVLEYCKQKFISHMGHRMGPVFADEPLELPQQHDSSSSGQRRVKSEPDNGSSPSEDSEDEMRRVQQRQRVQQQHILQSQQSTTYQGMPHIDASVPLAFRTVTTGYSEMPMVTQVDPMQPLYQNSDAYYEVQNMANYNADWSQQQRRH